MMPPCCQIHLLRHSESFKNLGDRHGGNGEDLTHKGRAYSQAIANLIKKQIHFENRNIICNESIQVIQTTEIISNELNTPFVTEKAINGLDLGIISGLSNTDCKHKYPDEYLKMEQWRKGEASMNKIQFKGGEDPSVFYRRVLSFLSKPTLDDKDIIIICTTSVYIMILNILTMVNDFNPQAYRNIPVPIGAYSLFDMRSRNVELVIYNHVEYF